MFDMDVKIVKHYLHMSGAYILHPEGVRSIATEDIAVHWGELKLQLVEFYIHSTGI